MTYHQSTELGLLAISLAYISTSCTSVGLQCSTLRFCPLSLAITKDKACACSLVPYVAVSAMMLA